MRLHSVLHKFYEGMTVKIWVCQQFEGCVDADVITGKFCDHFVKSYTSNNARRADELKQEYVMLRENYCGLPIIDNDHFDTEMVSPRGCDAHCTNNM